VRRAAARSIALVAALSLAGCGQIFGPKATLGPGAIVRGRGLYNDVISATNNEQTLGLVVRARYGEPIALLSVASVTANLHAATTAQSQIGFGAPNTYEGNLVPLTIGVAYEDNPTISYTPVQGERYMSGLLSPIGLDTLVLLFGIEHSPAELVGILVKHLNGLQNPMYGPEENRRAFRDAIAHLARLHDAGAATWTATATGGYALVIHDYAPSQRDTVRAFLRSVRLPESLMREGRVIELPLRLGLGVASAPTLNVQTRSVYDLIELAATGVEVPEQDAARGIADLRSDVGTPLAGFFTIHSGRHRPGEDVLVATRHRDHWFWIAANDGASKTVFRLLQSLIGMRLVDATPQAVPTLTIPVGK
jgi:hypothetical protein